MDLHFGPTLSRQEGLYMDFELGKREYQRYEYWNPNKRVLQQYESSK